MNHKTASDSPIVRRTGALTLLLIAALGCRSGDDTAQRDVLAQLGNGVYLEYGMPVALGQPGRLGDHPGISSWTPLPISAGDGWLRPARSGWSPLGDRAVLTYHDWEKAPGQPRMVRLDLRHRNDDGGRQRIEVSIAGQPVGGADLRTGFETHLFPLPDASLLEDSLRDGPLPQPLDIEITFDPPIERDRDSRRALTLVGFGLSTEPAIRAEASFGSSPTHDEMEGVLRFSRSGRLVAPLTLGIPIAALEFEWRCPTGAGRLDVSLLDDSGGNHLAGRLEACPAEWQGQTVPIAMATDGSLVVSLDIGIDSEGPMEIRHPVATLRQADSSRAEGAPVSDGEQSSTARPARPSHPDILLIILDAARAKQFGFSGYERNTTPNLDRLATESLVFERAFSECPNTACSIPNLITGVPFQNVGTVFKGKRIPEELTTLAEYLGPLGYRTVGFSSNPNNSAARNSHQGFDRFERIWGAHNQTDLAREEIARQPEGEPLYLQLHLLPPHQPYKPRPEFDLFTDPDYTGPVRPRMGLRRYSEGFATFNPDDVEQLMALYDGNLRMADDALEMVFEALRDAGRWENTLVLLTSDHGEAFGEHGSFSHNRTLFDEMLHVPLLLRLPGDERPDGIATDARVVLSDVVPTILGYLGLPPQPEVLGLDLLAAEPDLLAGRILFHRTLHRQRSQLGARGPRFVALTGKNGRWPLLFDQLEDPRQLVDLAAARPDLFAGLALRLRDFIALADARTPRDAEDVELSPEEIETLRALGYVE